MQPFISPSNSNRFVSMRVHGTSAHVQFDPADLPEKIVKVIRSSSGTLIQSNHPAEIEVYFSIPTPVIAERQFSLVTMFQRLFSTPVDQVFKGVRLKVVRVEVYVEHQRGINLGQITVMDGNRKLASAQISTLPGVNSSAPYFEQHPGQIYFELDHEVRSGLGIGISGGFTNFGPEENELLLTAAKGVFVISV